MSSAPQPPFGEFCWNELVTPDTQKAHAFYSALLGWTAQEHPMGEATYTMFMSGDKAIGGMMQIPKDQTHPIPPHWMSYICVADVDKTLEKAKTLGGKVKVPVTDVPGKGRFIIIEDPSGAHIAFWQVMGESC